MFAIHYLQSIAMAIDIREKAASYYDYNPNVPNDIPFYRSKIPSPHASILELGCGTGRVLLQLAEYCAYIHGVDVSEAMLDICRRKIEEAGLSPGRASVERGDISNFDLGRKFDLIIAPFRVFQNLETDAEVDGLFSCVRKHLSPDGTCILNVFRPNRDPDVMRREWCTDGENFGWETFIGGSRITLHDRRKLMDPGKLTLYPELIYRRYEGDVLKDETVLKIVMRCWYPEQFEALILDHDFRIVNRWGGYDGEPYGDGPELVVQFEYNIPNTVRLTMTTP
jgi:SAM-dependent methyltransferase